MSALGKHSPLVKELARLERASERRAQRRYLIEGVRILEEACRAGLALELLLYDPERCAAPRTQALVLHWSAVARETPAAVLEKLSPAETSQGLLGVAALPSTSVVPTVAATGPAFVLALDGVRDPGNLGTLLRTAWAGGVQEVVLLNCADPYGPKSVRSSAGGLFHVGARQASGLETLERLGLELVALTPRGGHDLYHWSWPERAVWILGGEACGHDEARLQRVPHRVTVPMAQGCESLNVAATGAVVLFERRRRYM